MLASYSVLVLGSGQLWVKGVQRNDTKRASFVTFILCVGVGVELLVNAWVGYSLLDVHFKHKCVHQGLHNPWTTISTEMKSAY